MNTRERVLKEALNCVNGEREKQYGSPEDNFSRIADLWSVYLTSLFEDEKIVVDIDPIDVAKMMILFKIARSNGDKDKLDNYVDILGYGACAAEIFENGNKEENKERNANIAKIFGIPIEKLGESEDLYQHFMKKNFGKEGKKFSEKIFRPGLTANSDLNNIELAEECKNCNYAKKCMGTGVCLKEKEDRNGILQKRIEVFPCDHIKVVEECRVCNYREKCMGTGVCLKEKEEKCVENGKKILDNFADLVNEKVRKKTEERLFNDIRTLYGLDDDVRIAIVRSDSLDGSVVVTDEEKRECKPNISKGDSFWDTYQSISAHITSLSKANSVNKFDVISWLTKNGHAPTDMTALVLAGRLNIDCVDSYIEKAIDELNDKESKK